MAVVIATGITATGEREVLGVDIGDCEDEVFWRGFLRSLKSRGLTGVRLVISDQHAWAWWPPYGDRSRAPPINAHLRTIRGCRRVGWSREAAGRTVLPVTPV